MGIFHLALAGSRHLLAVAEIPSRQDKWREHINTLYNLYYDQDLGKHPVPPGRDHINRPPRVYSDMK